MGKKHRVLKIKVHNELCKPATFKIGDWVDLSTNGDITLFAGEANYIPLGVSIELPEGYEALVYPRSGSLKKWGIIGVPGVIDESYCGDGDEWALIAYPTRDVLVPNGTRIAQFRILKHQPKVEFKYVDSLGNPDRKGHGEGTGD